MCAAHVTRSFDDLVTMLALLVISYGGDVALLLTSSFWQYARTLGAALWKSAISLDRLVVSRCDSELQSLVG